jgi:hypothetical protein
MKNYLVFVCEVQPSGLIQKARIELNHLCPPIATESTPETVALLDMAKEAVSFTDGLKNRCDLAQMCLIPPNPVAEAIHKLEGEP